MRKIDLYLLLKYRARSRQVSATRLNNIWRGVGKTILTLVVCLFICGLLFASFSFARFTRDLPSIEILPVLMDPKQGELLQPTRMVDRSGATTLFTYQEDDRERSFLPIDPLAANAISPQLIRTVIDSIDSTFWSNPGYDLKNWNEPAPRTITERLVSDLILWNEPSSSARAIRMRMLAGQLVSTYGRTQVLEWYLNSAWFGRYAFGVESAAQLYLGKSASSLTLAEAALLTATLQSPALNPLDAPQTALGQQQALLSVLLAQGAINEQEYNQAINEKITLAAPPVKKDSFAEGFIRQVEDQLDAVIGNQRLQRGGLTVYTTLDADLQTQLICTATTQLIRIQYSNVSGVAPESSTCQADLLLPTQNLSGVSGEALTAAGVVMNPSTGEILAYLEPINLSGERSHDSGYQPGSLLTPVVALSAFSRGYSPASLLWDVPASSENALVLEKSSAVPFQGPLTLRSALANDYLRPISALIHEIGIENISRLGNLVGLTSLVPAPTGIEDFYSSPTTLMELSSAYSTLANSGVRIGSVDPASGEITPITVINVVTPTGREIYTQSAPSRSVILDEPLAYLVNHVFSDESARWLSLGYPNELEIGTPVAAKTGIADDAQQVWTVGYTPQRLVLTWIGVRSDDTTSTLDVQMAAGLWHALFKYTSRSIPFAGWQKPAGVSEVKVCTPSGMLPTADCPQLVNEVFLFGNEPTMPDTLYTRVKINRETGLLATVFTPADLVEERTYLNIPAEAREWARDAGLDVIPQGYDAIQQTPTDPAVHITKPSLFSAVSGKVKIYGSAQMENFAYYQLQVGEGINPESWLQVGEPATQQVSEGLLGLWDTGQMDGLYAIRLTVVDQKNNVKTALTQVTVDNTPPSGWITYPVDGEEVTPVQGGVTLTARVEDAVSVAQVEWWIDRRLTFTQTSPPFVYQLKAAGGKHHAYVKVWDSAGNKLILPEITFTITP
ncbi:MAG: transglycosylase domain-containing protein [Anaerolineaceae bacterium]